MFEIFIEAIMVLVSAILFASYQSGANARKNMRMCVTLPHRFLDHPEVLGITKRYKKSNSLLFALILLATIPIFMIGYVSFQLLYLSLWLTADFMVSGKLFYKYNSLLLLLKSKNHWFGEEDDYRLLVSGDSFKKRSKAAALYRKWFPLARDRLLSMAKEPVYVDDDEYWISGNYSNPNDKRTMVEKRIGVGFTVNLATRKGKINMILTAVFISSILLTIFIMLLRFDFAQFQMNITDTNVIIQAPLYGYEFNLSEIEEVTLEDTLPKGFMKTNGAATDSYYLGNFIIDSYGHAKAYIYRDYPPYLIIRLKDKSVLFNSKTAGETEQYYDQLVGYVHQEN
jgi:hypothetical protein